MTVKEQPKCVRICGIRGGIKKYIQCSYCVGKRGRGGLIFMDWVALDPDKKLMQSLNF